MSITVTPKKVTAAQETLFRTPGQWSEVYCAIQPAAVVFTAQLNLGSLPASNDDVAAINYTGGAFGPGYTAALRHMTIWIGSTAGAYDLGMVRLRDETTVTAGSGTMKIGETSEIKWIVSPQVARYITIVDEFSIWPKHLRVVGPYTTGYIPEAYPANPLLVIARNFTGSYLPDLYNPLVVLPLSAYGGSPAPWPFTQWVHRGDVFVIETWDTWYSGGSPGGWMLPAFESEIVYVSSDQIHLKTPAPYNDLPAFWGGHWRTSPYFDWLYVGTKFKLKKIDVFMDYDILLNAAGDETNAHYTYPFPTVCCMGANRVVFYYGQNVTVQLDARDSWQIDNPSQTNFNYQWYSTGGTFSNATIGNPTITFGAPGVYRVSCRVRKNTQGSELGHRLIYVIDGRNIPGDAHVLPVLQIASLAGNVSSGGWQTTVTVYGDVSAYLVRPRAPVVLFAVDHYGSTIQSVGQVLGSENVLMIGWIVEGSITIDPELNSATFTVAGPQHWLKFETSRPVGMEDVGGTTVPGVWTEMRNLSVDRGLWHLCMWRTTVCNVTDVYLTGDARKVELLQTQMGKMWNQITQFAQQTILARPLCDRYGRVIVEIDPQLVPSASRTTPAVQQLLAQDIREQIVIQQRFVNEVAKMEVSGVYWDSSTAAPLVGKAPGGSSFGTHGDPDSVDRLALVNQPQVDLLAELLRNNRNNPFPVVSVKLAANNRLPDIAPGMYLTLNVAASQNSLGLDLSDFPFIPKSVNIHYDPASGSLLTDVEGEGYTDETTLIDGEPPRLSFSY